MAAICGLSLATVAYAHKPPWPPPLSLIAISSLASSCLPACLPRPLPPPKNDRRVPRKSCVWFRMRFLWGNPVGHPFCFRFYSAATSFDGSFTYSSIIFAFVYELNLKIASKKPPTTTAKKNINQKPISISSSGVRATFRFGPLKFYIVYIFFVYCMFVLIGFRCQFWHLRWVFDLIVCLWVNPKAACQVYLVNQSKYLVNKPSNYSQKCSTGNTR